MTEAIQTQEDAEECRAATPEEIELYEWARETQRKTLTVLVESLKQFIALDTALLGGSAAVFNLIQAMPLAKAGFFIFLLASLAVALCGAMPLTATILYNEDAKEVREKGVMWRSRCLWLAAALLFVAFAILGAGLLPVLLGYVPVPPVIPAAK